MRIILIFLFILVFQYCSSNENSKLFNKQLNASKDSESPVVNDSTQISQNPITDSKIVVLLERRRGDCFGPCPVYKLKIFSDGRVVFIGEENVREKKSVESRIDQEQLLALFREFRKINYFTMADKYLPKENCPSQTSDSQTVFTSYTVNEKTKSVIHYLGCEGTNELRKLTTLENNIDQIVGTKQWIK